MAAVVKISTPKAIKLLEDALKAKKAELAKYKSDVAQYKKDVKQWREDMVKEARTKMASITETPERTYNGVLEVRFSFKPSRVCPAGPENPRIEVREGRSSYMEYKYTVVERQIQQGEQLLKMLKLTDEDTVSAAVYKDLASLI